VKKDKDEKEKLKNGVEEGRFKSLLTFISKSYFSSLSFLYVLCGVNSIQVTLKQERDIADEN